MPVKQVNRRSLVALGALTATAIALFASLAWACTPAADIHVSVATAHRGSVVQVNGSNFNPAPVEVRWNSEQGPVLGTAQGPDFSVPVTIPSDAAPDVYYIVAVQSPVKAEDSVHGDTTAVRKSAIIQVTPSSGTEANRAFSNTNSDLWSGLAESKTPVIGSDIPAGSPVGTQPAYLAGLALLAVGALGLGSVVVLKTRRSSRAS